MNFFIQSTDFFLRMDFCTRKTNIFVWRRDMSLLVGESSVLTNGFLYSKERRFHRASRRNFYTANPRRLHSAAQGLFLSGERKRLRAASEGLLYWAEGQIDVANFPPRALAVDYWQIMLGGALRRISLCMASLFSALCSNYTRSGRPVKRSGIDRARNGRIKLSLTAAGKGKRPEPRPAISPKVTRPTAEFSHKTFTGQT